MGYDKKRVGDEDMKGVNIVLPVVFDRHCT
jgi:hypothetical protein